MCFFSSCERWKMWKCGEHWQELNGNIHGIFDQKILKAINTLLENNICVDDFLFDFFFLKVKFFSIYSIRILLTLNTNFNTCIFVTSHLLSMIFKLNNFICPFSSLVFALFHFDLNRFCCVGIFVTVWNCKYLTGTIDKRVKMSDTEPIETGAHTAADEQNLTSTISDSLTNLHENFSQQQVIIGFYCQVFLCAITNSMQFEWVAANDDSCVLFD